MQQKQHILLPIDFSDISMCALPVAAKIARYNSEISLLYVMDTNCQELPSPFVTVHSNLAPDNRKKAIQINLRKIRQSDFYNIKNVNIGITLSTNPAVAICRYAKRYFVDLIILTTRGLKGKINENMGGVATAVVNNSPCSVMVMCPGRQLRQHEMNTDGSFYTDTSQGYRQYPDISISGYDLYTGGRRTNPSLQRYGTATAL